MAQPWSAVEQSPEYQKLAPQEQQAAKQQYFSQVVAVKPEFQALPDNEKQVAASQFMGDVSKPPLQFKSVKEAQAGQAEAQKNQRIAEFNRNPLAIASNTIQGMENTVKDSAVNTVKNVADTVFHPIRTIGNLDKVGVGVMDKILPGSKQPLPEQQYANEAGKNISDRYGSPQKAFNTFGTDPVGAVLDASTVVAPGAMALGRVPVGVTNLGRIASKVGVEGDFIKNLGEFQNLEKKLGNIDTSASGQAINTSSRGYLPIKDNLDNKVTGLFISAVNPRTSQFKNVNDIKKYKDNILTFVKSIVNNKNKMNLTNEAGDSVVLPTDTKSLAEAIPQGKKQVFNYIDSITKGSTNAGDKVNVGGIAQSIYDEGIKTGSALQELRPEVFTKYENYVKEINKTNNGLRTPTQTQDILKTLNSELIKYYHAKDTNAVNLYADLARKLRTGLDDVVDTTLNKDLGHQAARNEYGAYKAVEDDVVKAFAKHTFAKDKELGGTLLNTFAGEELARAILFANPIALKAALTTKGFELARSWFRSPDRKINEMFQNASKYEPSVKTVSPNFKNPSVKTLSNYAESSNPRKLDISPTLKLPFTLPTEIAPTTAQSIRPIMQSKYEGPHVKAQSIQEPILMPKQPTQREMDIVNSKDPRDFRERNLILKRYGIYKGVKK